LMDRHQGSLDRGYGADEIGRAGRGRGDSGGMMLDTRRMRVGKAILASVCRPAYEWPQ
jgi:hypothetical protein